MTQLPTIYAIQASDAFQHTGRLEEILQNLKTENRINNFTMLGTEDDLSSLTDNIKDEDLILIVLTNQLEPQKEQIEQRFKDFKTSRPGVRVAEIIVDNVPYENEFITFPADLRNIRDREDMDAVWSGIEQSLKGMFPILEKKEPTQPIDWPKYLKIAGILIGVILALFIIKGLLSEDNGSPVEEIPEARPVMPAAPLMTDDFNDGNTNGWRVVDKGNIAGPSNWSVVRGEVRQSSDIFGPGTSFTENRKGTIAFYDNREAFFWTNYSLTAVLHSTDDDGIGLVFRYQNANNYYKLDLDRQRRFSKLFKVVNGEEFTLATVTGPGYTQGVDFKLVVKVFGNQIRVFKNGIDIFGGPITDHSLSRGTVGLYCWGNAGCYYDDVSVEPTLVKIKPKKIKQ